MQNEMMFHKIDEVQPPQFHKGQTVIVACSGKPEQATITRVRLGSGKQGRKVFWRWIYDVTVDGVAICRNEDEIFLGKLS